MTIIVDSDGLIGGLDPNDSHYESSLKINENLVKNHARLLYPATVIAESVTFLQGRLNKPDLAYAILQLIKEGNLEIEVVNAETLQKASELMDLKRSKHNTLFDCIVAVVAKEHNADAIFSFDKFYKSIGFKLASEL